MKQTIAVLKNMEHGYETLCAQEDEQYMQNSVRISDYIEVDFPELSGNEQIAGQVKKLDELRDREVDEHRRKLAAIDERKSKLMALSHDPA